MVGLSVVAFVAALVLHHLLYRYGSGDRDEGVYRYQAFLLRDGHLSVPASQAEFYRPWLTGLHAGRLVIPFTLPWAAALALSDALFGSPVFALGLAASALTIGTYLFTRALLGNRRTALLATALTTLSPFVLAQSGTYLNYVFALTLELFAGWALLRGIDAATRGQRGAAVPPGRVWPWLVAAGVLWASAVWCRPLDGVLVGLPFGVWALHQLLSATSGDEPKARVRRAAQPVGRAAGWLVLGALPIVAAMLAVNRKATGNALTFPINAQSGGTARVGWGPRGIFRNEFTIDYTLGKGFQSFNRNLAALPTWLIGSYLAIALALYGAWRLGRRDRPAAVLLVALALVCPIVYLAWFASALTAPGAYTGIGPHYYLPSAVALAALAAVGGRDLWARRPSLTAVGALAAVAVTVVFVVPKLQVRLYGMRYDRRVVQTVDRAVAARGDRPALVVLPRADGVDGVGRLQDDFGNRPDLSGPVVYALDRGPGLFDLVREQPDRVPFRLTLAIRPGADLATPDAVVRPITVVSGPVLEVHTTITNLAANPVVAATVEQGDRVESVELDDHAAYGSRYDVVWRLGPGGLLDVVVNGQARPVTLTLDPEGEIGIGVASGQDRTLLAARNPGRAVRTFPYRRNGADGTIEASTATAGFLHFGGPGDVRLPVDTSDQVGIELTAP